MKEKILFIGLLLSCSAHAQFKSGNKLYEQITSPSQMEQMNAIGYVTGVADTLQWAVVCAPSSINAGQLVDMTKMYLERSPARRHLAADALILELLRATWPCKEKGQSL